ncbi:MAG TPA: methyltransferase domain-containing protein [Mycobacteriales bacterium]|jgi:SAM-dependent methyltransferase|nr:methyltransferase domain-containing protein [Mycobacteriales bacterium]
MTHRFDKGFWDQHWQEGRAGGSPPNPYLAQEIGDLPAGTALDAGCGAGAEARWLAAAGWEVTAADISSEALARAAASDAAARVRWVQADLSVWDPGTQFDLVTTHYAHPAIPQLDFYERIAAWVAPGGTLLIVGHLHTHDGHGHGHRPPAEASATAAAVTARLDDTRWDVVTAGERRRTLTGPDGHEVSLDDVVVRATRRH